MADRAGDWAHPTDVDAIRRGVCGVCLDQRNDGACARAGRACAIERYWSAISRAVNAIDSDRMDPYYESIEAQVCRGCSDQDAAGRCSLRKTGDCALYSYLSLVVTAVEEAKKTRQDLPAPFF